MPKHVKQEEKPKVEVEEESEEEDSSDDSDDSEDSDDSDDSDDSSDDSSDSSEEEKADDKNKAKGEQKKDIKGKKKEEDTKGTKTKRSDEESFREQTAQQPEKKRVKQDTNGHSNDTKKPSSGTASTPEVQKWREVNRLTVVNLEDSTNNPCVPYEKFSDAPFPEFIQKSVRDFGFKTPTPIQAQTWPLALVGRDLVGIAETGSGKTLAFGYPAIVRIKANSKGKKAGPKALMLAPTRELAQQIHEVIAKACVPAGLTACCVFGGVSKMDQTRDIKKVDIVIATPGRLIDLLMDGSAQLNQVDYLVFDEADRMLDMGFIPQIRKIVESLPDAAKRQTLMYSATWPVDVQKFAQTYLRTPIQITIGGEKLSGAKKVTQIIEVCAREQEKKPRLKKLLQRLCAEEVRPRILVFMLYKHTCDSLYNELLHEKWNVECLHGGKTQNVRDKAVLNFKSGQCHILIATDVAARGLDIKDIKYVINGEMPLVMEDYIHRIGRTGRAGETGSAYTLFSPEDKVHARQLVRILEEGAQVVPPALAKIAETAPVTRPRKSTMEQLYGDYAKGADPEFMMRKPTKITFD